MADYPTLANLLAGENPEDGWWRRNRDSEEHFRRNPLDLPAPRREPSLANMLSNPGPRPADAMAPVAEALSPTMGAYGLGQLLAETYGKVKDADYTGALQSAAPLAFAAVPIPGAKLPRSANPIKAYHGSPHDFDKFKTPAFFSRSEGVARQYRNDGGGQDNLNGLGGYNTPEGWYWAHRALDRAGQNKAKAIEALEQEIKAFSTPHPRDYQSRNLVDAVLGRPAKLRPEFEDFVQRHTAVNRAGIDYLKSDAPLGKIYEAEMPRPTAHYDGDQAADIADAIAKGHKVITWGRKGAGEIIALDKNVINILRKYGIAGPTAASILAQHESEPQQ